MSSFTKESLEKLRQRIDLVEVLEPYVELKKAGASYKALCPFHDEKSPSFVVKRGDTHYHCFGCGAHGDAIQFLIERERMSFAEAVEMLANTFQVPLEKADHEEKGPSKKKIYEALSEAMLFYHCLLLHTEEGHDALNYLYRRGISLQFLRDFSIGLAPKSGRMFQAYMQKQGVEKEYLLSAGLVKKSPRGDFRDFFYDRILFPIFNPQGRVIGFSGRKYREETFGGKYVNTSETPVFKKSRVLYGMNYCRRRIAKERKAVIVEGQIDCLKLIHQGLNLTVAGQGTAFGKEHVEELLQLGVNSVYLVMDGDKAGREAAVKIGNLFQKAGVEVHVAVLPEGEDPDLYTQKRGMEPLLSLIEKSGTYLEYLVSHFSEHYDLDSPAGKNELVFTLASQIRSWDKEIMVRESLRKLASMLQVPEEMIGVDGIVRPNVFVKKSASVDLYEIDPDFILETDFLRWIFLIGIQNESCLHFAKAHLEPDDLHHPLCQKIYHAVLHFHSNHEPFDLMTLAMKIDDPTAQEVFDVIHRKRVNKEKYQAYFPETILKILNRNWIQKRDEITRNITEAGSDEEKTERLLKEFDALKKSPPEIKELKNG